MFRNSHNSRGSSTHARNPVPRWRSVFIALVLALTIGSAGQTPLAQAAPASAGPNDIKFALEVFPETLPTICVNQKLYLYVSVSKTIFKVINDQPYEIPGNVGSPYASGSVTGANIGTLKQQLGFAGDEDPVNITSFIFTGKKPGTTTLKFTAAIRNSWIGANEEIIGSSVKLERVVTVKVRNCKFKVETFGQWNDPGGSPEWFTAVSKEAVVTADADGHFSGSASVNWAGRIDVPPCGYSAHQIASGQANYSGEMDESGQLMMNQTYEPVEASYSYACRGGGGSGEGLFTSDSISVSMPASGGVSTLDHVLHMDWMLPAGVPGSVTIIVIPVEDEAVAFNADQPLSWVGSPSLSWWAVRWDDLP